MIYGKKLGRSKIRKASKKGSGFINELSNKLTGKVPEMHLLGDNACGPFTNVEERLKKEWKGINPLDGHCKQHDLFYYTNPNADYSEIQKADKTLQEVAWLRVLSPDTSQSERFWAWIITNAMKLKTKLGMGAHSEKDLLTLLKRALMSSKTNNKYAKNLGGFPWLEVLAMIFTGLYYLLSSSTEIYRTIKETKFQDETLKEQIRHNKVEEKFDVEKINEDKMEKDRIEADKMMPFVYHNFDVPHSLLFKYRY